VPEPSLSNPFAVPQRLKRLQIEVTSRCTLACRGCQRTIALRQRRWADLDLSVESFQQIVRHMPPADLLVLQGVGEPTLHPALAEMIRLGRASRRFQDISFNTNALAQPVETFAALRAAGLGHLSISVDSLEPETAARARAGTDVGELSQRIGALVRLFEGRVTLSVTLSRLNQGELGPLLDRLAHLGGRVIEIQPLVAYAGGPEDLALSPVDLARATELIEARRRALPGVEILPAAAMTPNGTRCRRPLQSAYVTVEGLLTPCCVTNDTALWGRTSVLTQPFARAWAAPGVAGWLSGSLDAEPAVCLGCGFNPRGAVDARLPELVEGRRLRKAGRLADAAALLRKGAARLPVADLLGEMGLALVGDAAAGPLLTSAVRVGSDPAAARALVEALARQGKGDAALRLALVVLERHPGADAVWADTITLVRRVRGAGVRPLIELAGRALALGAEGGLARLLAALAEAEDPEDERLTFANQLRIQGRADLARRLVEPLVERAPGDVAALMTLCVCQLEIVYLSDEEIAAQRARFLDLLARTEAALAAAESEDRTRAARQVGNAKPFYLAYQGHDDRAAMAAWGRIVTALVAAEAPPLPPAAPAEGRRLRLGIASAYLRLHSVSKLFGGWLPAIDRKRFEVVGYDVRDRLAEGEAPPPLAAACDLFRAAPRRAEDWPALIAGDRLDILIYPEVGMDPLVARLAALRLAPVQCVAWGHPVTSGLPSVDLFLSSDLMEPDGAEAHYTERLVRLPNLSITYRPPVLAPGRPLGRAAFGLTDQDVVFLCCQSLYKYLPAHDHVFARIAEGVPQARFVFIVGPDARSTERFRRRLAATFPGPAAPWRIVPRIAHEDFAAFMALGDVYLDSIGWSGGNTTLEAVAVGLPVVTIPVGLMRGRHSAAILTRAGLGDLVAADPDDYVRRAIALGTSAEARAEARRRLEEGRDALYDDLAPVRALEQVLIAARAGR